MASQGEGWIKEVSTQKRVIEADVVDCCDSAVEEREQGHKREEKRANRDNVSARAVWNLPCVGGARVVAAGDVAVVGECSRRGHRFLAAVQGQSRKG